MELKEQQTAEEKFHDLEDKVKVLYKVKQKNK